MVLTMAQIDDFIDTALNRLSTEGGELVSNFYVDLHSYQKRITQNLVKNCEDICRSRGLEAVRNGNGLVVTVDLNTCLLNPEQARCYSAFLAYSRSEHGENF